MLTQNYNKKINRYIALYKFAYRFRVLLCTIVVVIALTTATLMGIVGVVINDIAPINVTYGDDFELTASALFKGAAKVEYAPSGSNSWSNEKPENVGTYDARAVSTNIFGLNSYGAVHTFNIEPRSIKPTVVNGSFRYGDNPDLVFANLKDGDSLVYRDYKLENVNTEPSLSFEEGDFRIADGEGNDVTANYKIDYAPVGVDLTQKSVNLSINASKEYDGTPLYANTEDVLVNDELVEGDHIEIMSEDSLTNAGSSKLENTDIHAVNETYGDVTGLYDFKLSSSSSLTVDKREVTLNIKNFEKAYDGKSTSFDDSYVTISDGSLVEGDTIEYVFNNYIDSGTYDIEPYTITVKDKDGNDVTDNYHFNVVKGTCVINKIDVTIKTPSASFAYDGNFHEANEFEIVSGHLVDGQTLQILNNYVTESGNVGSYENRVSVNIVDENGNSTLKNYNITYQYGTIEIVKKDLVVSSPDLTMTYNGNSMPNFDKPNQITCCNQSDLASGDTVDVVNQKNFASILPGEHENYFEVRILDTSGNDKTFNYNIIYDYGTVTINKRDLNLKTSSAYYYYSEGEKFSANSYETFEGLGSGDEINGVDYTVVEEIGIFDNEITPVVLNSEGSDVTVAYNITLNYGQIEVAEDVNDYEDVTDGTGGELPPEEDETSTDVANSGANLIDKKPNEGGEGSEDPGDPENPEDPSGPNDPDNPSDPENPENPDDPNDPNNPDTPTNPPEENYYFTFKVSANKDYYFRQNVYCNYNNGQLYLAPTYNIQRLSLDSNPDLYVAKLLEDKKEDNFIEISYSSKFKFNKDVAPYYVSKFPQRQNFEGAYDFYGSTTNNFLSYSGYNFLSEGFAPINLENKSLNGNASNYTEFVQGRYLSVPEYLNSVIDEIVERYRLKGTNEFDTIYNIARWVSTKNEATTANLYTKDDEPVLKFLTETHQGKDSHFATAYAMMLRRVGIPARVASGYIAQGRSGTDNKVNSNNKATWTEVYSSDLEAWVTVNTFPSYAIKYTPAPYDPDIPEEPDPEPEPEPDPESDPEPDPEPEPEPEPDPEPEPEPDYPRDPVTEYIHISSPSFDYSYDGMRHQCSNSNYNMEGNLLPYDKIEIQYNRSVIECTNKPVPNTFTYKIIDTRNNKNVTNEYKGFVDVSYGELTVEKVALDIYSLDISKEYDGEPINIPKDCYAFGKNGLQGEDYIENIIFLCQATEKGSYENKFLIRSIKRPGYNKDIKGNYIINDVPGTITIY